MGERACLSLSSHGNEVQGPTLHSVAASSLSPRRTVSVAVHLELVSSDLIKRFHTSWWASFFSPP